MLVGENYGGSGANYLVKGLPSELDGWSDVQEILYLPDRSDQTQQKAFSLIHFTVLQRSSLQIHFNISPLREAIAVYELNVRNFILYIRVRNVSLYLLCGPRILLPNQNHGFKTAGA